ncbi:XrtN system VIT domain-containing protein [Rufibacter sp. XAAS-G3-1]|uniref:XrtN system VIT domain-containing protein n=1 Tax=Rufibacter sp. XAAS-G3-1 TaxID=2729134 RepID=UPI0015E7CC2F|nr:XrtN system VIT domain-containing protein [Rufibacter sp. XAAS-G3-1]
MNFELQSTLETPVSEAKTQKTAQKPLLLVGLACIVVSFGIFLLQEANLVKKVDGTESLFMLNFLMAGGYLIALRVQRLFRFNSPLQQLDYLMLFLVAGLISCFSLNREIPLFLPSVDWFSGWLLAVSLGMVGYAFRFLLPRALYLVMVFLLGTGTVLFSYFALYLAPYYHVGLLGTIVLGLGLHMFVPFWSAISLTVAALRMAREDIALKKTFLMGILVPILFALVYLSLWQAGHDKINRILNSYQVQDQQELPRWVALSQQIPHTPIFERLVQTDLLYQTAAESSEMFNFPSRSFEELQRHDPLVVLATRFFGKPQLTTQERIKIMESRFDARHLAQERLWSGDHLSTSNVITQAQLFPRHRFSYTEKILTVYNNQPSSWAQEEAIYTFHLPQGSVVTSLSLWINGKEEKGRLTTQSKADSAYTTIVGVEVRDPSVVHWQEGNTVSVRVFPCTPQERRQFKIGVTSPLRLDAGQLVYENIYFDGPSAKNAPETTIIRVEESTSALPLPREFNQTSPGRYERYGNYEPDWSFKIAAAPLSTSRFTFAGQSYQMQPYAPPLTSFSPTRIYLDLNKAWSEEEFMQVWNAAKNAKVYAYAAGTMTKLTDENHAAVFRQLRELNFSLFPLHLVKEPELALIISKSTGNSPHLSDLQDSRFALNFAKTAPKREPIRFFHLGTTPSPYVKTIKELRLLQYDQGSAEELVRLLAEKQFVAANQDQNSVILGEAGVQITRSHSAETTYGAPDHLMRLFAYNHLLQQIGPAYFQQNYLEQHLIAEAAQANVVSPLSSLVVLETKADYERFGIEESKNSLGNASVKSSGAVPEPHEWALIFLVILVVSFSVLKPRMLS